MTISVVIPAHDAQDTVAATLDSLLAQTSGDWEAVVVDDGSTDGTAAILADYAARDPRFRVVAQARAGVGSARNAGIAASRGEWLLFLDADDWIAPTAIERFARATAPGIDTVVAGWERVFADGTRYRDPVRLDPADMFPALARYCPFAIHACLVRRSRVEAAGGFELGMPVGEDWDLWQRLARAGARFAVIDDVLAFYRVRPRSAGVDVARLAEAGVRLVRLGHAADPRVPAPDPRYAAGRPADELASALLGFICWPAGMRIGSGEDATALLRRLGATDGGGVDPKAIAGSLHIAGLLPHSRPPSAWPDLWDRAEPRLRGFLAALERRVGDPGLARRTERILEGLVIADAPGSEVRIGSRQRCAIELAAPLDDVVTGRQVEHLHCALRFGGEPLGELELPVCDGRVPAAVVADAAADRFGWAALGRFFERAVYPTIERRTGDAGTELWRGPVRLAERLSEDAAARTEALHDAIGWTVFLQELWGEPARDAAWFYDDSRSDDPAPAAPATDEPAETSPPPTLWERLTHVLFGGDWKATPDRPDAAARPVVELSGPIVEPIADGPRALVELRIGGAAVALLPVATVDGVVPAAALRARATAEGGYELCRVAVREGLFGLPLDDPRSLRERLAAAAARSRSRAPVPRWVAEIAAGRRALAVGRHRGPVGGAASRRAALPGDCADVLRAAALAAGEAVVERGGRGPTRVVYAPEILLPGAAPVAVDEDGGAAGEGARARQAAGIYDLHYFETLFTAGRDPWFYTTEYEALKYDQTLGLVLEGGAPDRVLELACAEGIFTERLASNVGEVLATDFAHVAVERTAARCAALANVRVERLDIVADSIPPGFDTIICSEVLYFLGGRDELGAVARKFAEALRPGGRIVLAHANVVVDDPAAPGFDWDVPIGAKGIGEVFAATPGLRLDKELRTPLYRVQRFDRLADGAEGAPPSIEAVPWRQPAPHVAARFLPDGGEVAKGSPQRTDTYELPILMYHSVAPDGPPALARYRVSPAAFEAQLAYLREAGFRGVTPEEWRRAKQRWEPLPGRAVMLTFDDGYRDFADHAWPLLKRYGFGALVFLPTDHVGGTSRWDAARGGALELLDWETVRRLRDEGVEFGSHSASHALLAAASPAEVVREAAGSRAALCRELGAPPAAFAYPHGSENQAVQHLVGAAGYTFGFSCRPGRSRLDDPLLALSRIEVVGTDRLETFIAKLG